MQGSDGALECSWRCSSNSLSSLKSGQVGDIVLFGKLQIQASTYCQGGRAQRSNQKVSAERGLKWPCPGWQGEEKGSLAFLSLVWLWVWRRADGKQLCRLCDIGLCACGQVTGTSCGQVDLGEPQREGCQGPLRWTVPSQVPGTSLSLPPDTFPAPALLAWLVPTQGPSGLSLPLSGPSHAC